MSDYPNNYIPIPIHFTFSFLLFFFIRQLKDYPTNKLYYCMCKYRLFYEIKYNSFFGEIEKRLEFFLFNRRSPYYSYIFEYFIKNNIPSQRPFSSRRLNIRTGNDKNEPNISPRSIVVLKSDSCIIIASSKGASC